MQVKPTGHKQELTRAEEAAERGSLDGVDHSRLKVEEDGARDVLAARGLVVEDVDAVELSIVVAGVQAVAANAVLVAHDLLRFGWCGKVTNEFFMIT